MYYSVSRVKAICKVYLSSRKIYSQALSSLAFEVIIIGSYLYLVPVVADNDRICRLFKDVVVESDRSKN